MKRNNHSLFFLLLPLLFLGGNALAQAGQDTVKVDTLRNKFLPTGLRIGTDVISHVKSIAQNDFGGWEIQGDIDFNRYYLALEYGSWGRDYIANSAAYANRGRYWRAGVDVNFLMKDPDRNMFFLGARYARSVFTESMNVYREDPNWGILDDNFHQADVNAWWIELTAGLKVKVWKIFWLGYTGRFKFALSAEDRTEMIAYDVPGFGRTNKETTWGFNYYLMLRIPIRNAPPPAVEKN